jgi:hypothetical protein
MSTTTLSSVKPGVSLVLAPAGILSGTSSGNNSVLGQLVRSWWRVKALYWPGSSLPCSACARERTRAVVANKTAAAAMISNRREVSAPWKVKVVSVYRLEEGSSGLI